MKKADSGFIGGKVVKRTFSPKPTCHFCGSGDDLVSALLNLGKVVRCRDAAPCRQRMFQTMRSDKPVRSSL